MYGVQLDKSKYDSLIQSIKNAFFDVFACDVSILDENHSTDFMGAFSLRYFYLPLEIVILFESERKRFEVRIIDKQGASNQLYRIIRFNPELSLANAKDAIEKLKLVLMENKFDLYLTQGDKLYKISGKNIVRIKNIREIAIKREDRDI